MEEYSGPFTYRTMPEEVYRAYRTWHHMRVRSKRMGLPLPEMTSRQFVAWWLKEIKTFKGHRPSVGRIDHTRPYSWDNFIMQDLRENVVEAITRPEVIHKLRSYKGQPITLRHLNGDPFVTFFTQQDAAFFLKTTEQYVSVILKNKHKNRKRKFLLERVDHGRYFPPS